MNKASRILTENAVGADPVAAAAATSAPAIAFLLPTGRCNLHCAGCYATLEQHGRHARARDELGIERIREIVAELVAMGVRTFDISGGEPLLYQHIAELCETIRSHPGTRTWLVTNGAVGGGSRLAQLGPLDRLVFSLDGSAPATHDSRRGVDGAFAKTMLSLRAARCMGFGELTINFMTTKDSIAEAGAMLRLARDEQVDRLALLTFRDVSENGIMFSLIPSLAQLQAMWRGVAEHLASSPWPAAVDLVAPSFLFPETTGFRNALPPELRARIVLHHPHLRGHSAFRETIVVKPTGEISGDTAMINDALFDIGNVSDGVAQVWSAEAPAWRERLAARVAALRVEAPCRECSRWRYCRGGCPAAALHQWSQLNRHDRSCDGFRAAGEI